MHIKDSLKAPSKATVLFFVSLNISISDGKYCKLLLNNIPGDNETRATFNISFIYKTILIKCTRYNFKLTFIIKQNGRLPVVPEMLLTFIF